MLRARLSSSCPGFGILRFQCLQSPHVAQRRRAEVLASPVERLFTGRVLLGGLSHWGPFGAPQDRHLLPVAEADLPYRRFLVGRPSPSQKASVPTIRRAVQSSGRPGESGKGQPRLRGCPPRLLCTPRTTSECILASSSRIAGSWRPNGQAGWRNGASDASTNPVWKDACA